MIYKVWWKYYVLRGEGIPVNLDGMWYEMKGLKPYLIRESYPTAILEPTNMWEQREDGEVAVVYKISVNNLPPQQKPPGNRKGHEPSCESWFGYGCTCQ